MFCDNCLKRLRRIAVFRKEEEIEKLLSALMIWENLSIKKKTNNSEKLSINTIKI